MPLVDITQTSTGHDAMRARFKTEDAFKRRVEDAVAKHGNELFGMDILEGGINVQASCREMLHSSMPADIVLGITIWKGSAWPATATLDVGTLATLEVNLEGEVTSWFPDGIIVQVGCFPIKETNTDHARELQTPPRRLH